MTAAAKRLVRQPLRERAKMLIEHWIEERERATVRPSHPLETVRDLHLSAGEGCVAAKETRPSGRSKPPIRDMDRTANQVHQIMRTISHVNVDWSRALESVVRCGKVSAAVEIAGKKRSALAVDYAAGMAAFQMEMVHRGLG